MQLIRCDPLVQYEMCNFFRLLSAHFGRWHSAHIVGAPTASPTTAPTALPTASPTGASWLFELRKTPLWKHISHFGLVGRGLSENHNLIQFVQIP